MLLQASVDQVRQQEISRDNSQIVITMCYYPRGVKKEWRDDFRSELAPDRKLFKDWKQLEKQAGHDQAFELSQYEDRFSLSPVALYHLKKYSELSHRQDIYFVCQCKIGEKCHREMLLLTAKEKYNASIGPVFHLYPVFKNRIAQLDDNLKFW